MKKILFITLMLLILFILPVDGAFRREIYDFTGSYNGTAREKVNYSLFNAENFTGTRVDITGNLTLGQKITFAFDEIIDNIVDGWIRITGNLNVTGESQFNQNVSLSNNSLKDILSTHYGIEGCTEETFGTFCYDATYDTMRFVTESGQILQMNQEMTQQVKNLEGSNVIDGSVIYLMGATGDNNNFKLAKADNLSTSGLLGVLTKDCNNNQVCPAVFFATVHGLDTTDFVSGDHLYLSATEEGNFTTTPPEFPNVPIWVATALRIHATEGTVFVFPKMDSANGITINSLGLIGDIIQTDYKIRSQEGHANLNGKNVFTLIMNGTTGVEVPHVVFQPGGDGQAGIWTRGGIVVPENLVCLNNTNRTDAQCWATAGGFTWNIADFNTTNTEGADWGITGELEVVKDGYIGGNLNVTGNITIGERINQDNYTIYPVVVNDNVIDSVFCLEMNSPDGDRHCKLVIQPGGEGQASIIRRSFAIVNDEACTGVNATNMQCYADVGGFTWNIDFNTSTSGADVGIADDLEVIGDIWLTDTEGESHFFSRTLQLLDELFENILFNDANLSIVSGVLNINDTLNETLVVNLNRSETIFTTLSDSISLNIGTNITPSVNHISYQNPANPTLTIDTSEPTVPHAEVVVVYVGGDASTIYLFENTISHNEQFVDQTYDTFGDLGGIYKSGLAQTMSTIQLNISTGIVRLKMNKKTYTNNLVSTDGFFYINSTGNFVQCTDNTCLTKYTDDSDISNNRYYTIVWGVVPIDNNQQKLMALLQSNPGSGREYKSAISAEEDTLSKANFFPSNVDFKEAFIPVARTIHKRTGNNDFVTLPTTGELFQDLRGKATVGSGGVPSPPLSDHSLLDNLEFNESGHTFSNSGQVLNIGSYNLTTTGNGSFDWLFANNWGNVTITSSQVTDFDSSIEGLFNSSSWNRSGTNVSLANPGDHVGIGTNTPESMFTIADSVAVAPIDDFNKYQILIHSTGTNPSRSYGMGTESGTMWFNSDSTYNFYRDGSNLDVTFKDGDVGIGTASPAYKLEVSKVDKAINLSAILYINGSSNRVGIGTSSPTDELNVVGNVNITNNLTLGETITLTPTSTDAGSHEIVSMTMKRRTCTISNGDTARSTYPNGLEILCENTPSNIYVISMRVIDGLESGCGVTFPRGLDFVAGTELSRLIGQVYGFSGNVCNNVDLITIEYIYYQ